MRAATMTACIEPDSVKECRTLMSACRTKNIEPSYTLEECAKVLSSLESRTAKQTTSFYHTALESMGPGLPHGEACTLRNVLPYQPWGPSWDGTFDPPAKKKR
jgi:hypothetical protein